ncbi:MAG: TIGR03986 family CRISPR-associated RAMP protein [Lachnospiraceae bacterium]|nr:TIGR03986 family CRISPR-associated RAMP protein [Lachnospiraceae bacterium]
MYNFVNPYNFVPFGKEKPDAKDKEAVYRGEKQKNLLSGWLDVDILVKTPLIIPDGAHPKYCVYRENKYIDAKEYKEFIHKNKYKERDIHKEFDFLKMYNPSTDNVEYAIPGSTLRGLIRSAYESVTNSCVPLLLHDKPTSQRVPVYGALTKRGLLGYENNRWVLYSTTKMLEEVIVIPLYNIKNNYCFEALDKIRRNNENKKYGIYNHLDKINDYMKSMKYKNNKITCGVKFQKEGGGISVKQGDNTLWQIEPRDKKIEKYYFIKADENRVCEIKGKPGDLINNYGVLQYNVPVNTSKVYHIAYLKKDRSVYRWPADSPDKKNAESAEAYNKLLSALKRDGVSGNLNNTNKQCNEALKKALENARDGKGYVPVYYFTVNEKDEKDEKNEIKHVYMSGSAIGRIAQRRKWNEIMDVHKPCKDKLCPACLLFGTISNGGMKSHIRVTDAYLDEATEIKKSKHTLRILSSPRATAFEFYLDKPLEGATYWNYDFYGVTETDNNGNTHTNYYHLDKSMLRGRKMYWHHKPVSDDKKSNMNETMESLDNGRFKHRVYFDQITETQLKDLIWTITLGDNNEQSRYMHKLGHAKPLGYGSAKLIVKGGCVRSFDTNNGFNMVIKKLDEIGIDINNITPSFDITDDSVKSFMTMSDSKSIDTKIDVDYPKLLGNGRIYKWFAENRVNANSLKTLPQATDNSVVMSGDDNRKKRRS